MSEIAEAAFQYQVAPGAVEKRIVGVNCHAESRSPTTWRSCGSCTRSRSSRSAARGPPGSRRRGGPVRPSSGWSPRPDRREHDRAHARRVPCRGDAGRDLRRAAGRVGSTASPRGSGGDPWSGPGTSDPGLRTRMVVESGCGSRLCPRVLPPDPRIVATGNHATRGTRCPLVRSSAPGRDRLWALNGQRGLPDRGSRLRPVRGSGAAGAARA